MEKIVVEIGEDGGIEYAVSGVKGSKCRDLTKLIDKLGTVTETKITGEYCQIETQVQQKLGGSL